MALSIITGLDFDRIGELSMVVTDAGGSHTLSLTSGTYCGLDISSVMGSGNYTELGAAIESDLNAATSLTGTYTCSLTLGTLKYNIAADVTFSATSLNTVALNALGFSGDFTSVTSKNSDVTPYYIIDTEIGGKSNFSGDRFMQAGINTAIAMDGTQYSVGPVSFAVEQDFAIPFEPRAAVWKQYAESADPWTWEHFWEHVQCIEPWVANAGASDRTVHKLRDRGGYFSPTLAARDWDTYASLTFRTLVLGRL